MTSPFPPGAFDKQDGSPDTEFYEAPRLVNHIDEFAIAAVGEAYRRFLPPGGDYLDLMSSWVSHYPMGMPTNRVVGHGMNELELLHNHLLTDHFVQDLNLDPELSLPDNSFDGVTICVSVQYLTQPVAVFRRDRTRAQARLPADRRLLQPLLPHQGRRRLAGPR